MPGFCLYGCVDAVEVGKICRIARIAAALPPIAVTALSSSD
jgi:hypothetical protein